MPTVYPSHATIGILTALPKECAAVRCMLEGEIRGPAREQAATSEHSYYVGHMPADSGGRHVVVVALLPDMGNNSAASTATRLLSDFKGVRHLIMCGIAGGVPRPGDTEHDVRLGDIVVSNRGGVVQYDLIKERPDGSKEPRHPPRPPGAALLGAVRHLLTEEALGRRPWEAWLARCSSMAEGSRLADDRDARGDAISYPLDSRRAPGLPRVFPGTIAAANILLKNAAHRDYLGATFSVKAIEMEGSGVADAAWFDGAGYLVVRGICDYCDDKKGDVWQGAAAVAAAAYTRAVIASMPAVGAPVRRASPPGAAGKKAVARPGRRKPDLVPASQPGSRSSAITPLVKVQAAARQEPTSPDPEPQRPPIRDEPSQALWTWLEQRLRGAPEATRLLAMGVPLARQPKWAWLRSAAEGAKRPAVRDVTGIDLPAAVADALLAVPAPTVAEALNAAHEAAEGPARALLGEVLFHVLPFAVNFAETRRRVSEAIQRNERSIELPFRFETLAEIVSAGVDGRPIDVIATGPFPAGVASMALPATTYAPLFNDKNDVFVHNVVLQLCREDGRANEQFVELRQRLVKDPTTLRRLVQVLLQSLHDSRRPRYILFNDQDLKAEVEKSIDDLWGLVRGAIEHKDRGLDGLRLIRLRGDDDAVEDEYKIALHIRAVKDRR
jgi:nucleoside phosphorylase